MSEAELLQAIKDHADDDAPRLAYAALLEARGDPRGEFIRIEVDRARNQDESPHPRTKELLAAHGAAWTSHLPEWARACDFRRGFIDVIRVPSAQHWLEIVDQAAAMSPAPRLEPAKGVRIELSPNRSLLLEITTRTENNGGTGGMGHDSDDYFQHTLTAQVYELKTRAPVASRAWTTDYNANDQSSSGERPQTVTFASDGRSLIAHFKQSEEIVPIGR